MRWVVGDIQGCAGQLERLLVAIDFDPGRDELWSLGDLVNKGPDSLATVRLWGDTGGRGVLGNHDIHAVRAYEGGSRRGGDTFDELLAAADAGELIEALRNLPLLVHLPGGDGFAAAWLVHAGIHPSWSDLGAVAARINPPPHDEAWLAAPETAFATRARCCTEAGEMSPDTGPPRDRPAGYRPWDDFYHGETRVVHGHWAHRGVHRSGRVIGLDSGCVYGGKLTAWCQEEDRIVQV